MDFKNQLNDAQYQAVSSDSFHSLILAGAGSGKTRVLIYRIIWLINQQITSPHNILALTFTNKAAKEMIARIAEFFDFSRDQLWVGTFHSICHKILRIHYQKANLSKNFIILDAAASKSLVKSLIKENNWQDLLDPNELRNFIDKQKENAQRSNQVQARKPHDNKRIIIYQQYEQICQLNNWVDFAEILLRCYELLQKEKIIRDIYCQRFGHILVDEFQDTNTIQYLWLKILSSGNNQFFVVGDDDQSIYGWRGAKVENIHCFQEDFVGADIIRLEQNYRSTAAILKAANHVIAQNKNRLGKKLWTKGAKGELIDLFAAFNDIDEARFVISQIEKACENGLKLAQIALLYRTNAQSRIFEEYLLQNNINYVIYGGLRFYERAEIKDAISYLRLVNSYDDNLAFERVVMTPSSGIGIRTVEKLRQIAKDYDCSLWQAITKAAENNLIPARALNFLSQFKLDFTQLSQSTIDLNLASTLDLLIEKSNLLSHYHKETEKQIEARQDNLIELLRAAEDFEYLNPDNAKEDFCDFAALEAGEYQAGKYEDAVQLMSLHAAKGLEFDLVFIVGIEEGIFPSYRSFTENAIEEERRLFYVGITRAKKKLILSYAQSRRVFGQTKYYRPSAFLQEIPKDCLQTIRLQTQAKQDFNFSTDGKKPLNNSNINYQIGSKVRHDKFGNGMIVAINGDKLFIDFIHAGQKCLIAKLAKLEIL